MGEEYPTDTSGNRGSLERASDDFNRACRELGSALLDCFRQLLDRIVVWLSR